MRTLYPGCRDDDSPLAANERAGHGRQYTPVNAGGRLFATHVLLLLICGQFGPGTTGEHILLQRYTALLSLKACFDNDLVMIVISVLAWRFTCWPSSPHCTCCSAPNLSGKASLFCHPAWP